jgi:tRNA A37 threonylcarbamoyladenosine dehydratase
MTITNNIGDDYDNKLMLENLPNIAPTQRIDANIKTPTGDEIKDIRQQMMQSYIDMNVVIHKYAHYLEMRKHQYDFITSTATATKDTPESWSKMRDIFKNNRYGYNSQMSKYHLFLIF